MMADDLESLPLVEIIRLQEQLSALLERKFSRELALVFTDVVGSTAYFARYGDAAGRVLQQRHIDLLQQAISPYEGRIVDTAGDGAFSCFIQAEAARRALCALLELATEQNIGRTREHQLVLRCGLHYGRVLTDGVIVSGDAVNVCARIAATANPGQIRLTGDTVRALPMESRSMCSVVGPVYLKGIATPVDMRVLAWRNPKLFPAIVHVAETNTIHTLPEIDVIAFGRMGALDGEICNDIVLLLPDEQAALQISRFHFELRRRATGFVLRPVSSGRTVVDGNAVSLGEEAPIRPGSVVQLSGVITLTFRPRPLVIDPMATLNQL